MDLWWSVWWADFQPPWHLSLFSDLIGAGTWMTKQLLLDNLSRWVSWGLLTGPDDEDKQLPDCLPTWSCSLSAISLILNFHGEIGETEWARGAQASHLPLLGHHFSITAVMWYRLGWYIMTCRSLPNGVYTSPFIAVLGLHCSLCIWQHCLGHCCQKAESEILKWINKRRYLRVFICFFQYKRNVLATDTHIQSVILTWS